MAIVRIAQEGIAHTAGVHTAHNEVATARVENETARGKPVISITFTCVLEYHFVCVCGV